MDVDDLTSALVEACKTYTEEVVQKVEDGIAEIGKEATDEVRGLAPVGKGGYRRNWTYRIDRTRGEYKVTVHVKGEKLILPTFLNTDILTVTARPEQENFHI